MTVMNRVELKVEAKKRITGKVFNLFVVNLIVIAIGLIAGIPYIGFIITIAFMVLEIGLSYFYLNFVDKGQIDYKDILFTFKRKDINVFFNHLGTILVMVLIIFLWSLLFLIPGIIKAIAYSQALYIKAEKPDTEVMECLRESEELMRNHKMEYFILQLSFIGWYLLIGITFGLAYIYVGPYLSTTNTLYYRQLRPLQVEINLLDGKIEDIADKL